MPEITAKLSTALAGRYKIESRLGEGGMATVYLAEDLKHKRKVALKVLKPDLAAVLGAERFVQEITTTANLQHPHILPLFDSGTAGETDGGTPFLYYVMPYVEGETLRDKLDRETQLSVEESVKTAGEVLDALQHAHEQGVIHRDIKPENILLQNGRPMVADFGIALAVSAAAGGRMTETGLSLGTPHYMSPEQATAEKDLTARSDVYSVGSVLYEMLTGSPPHVGASAQQIIMKIVTEEAQPVTAIRKSVPPNVAAAVAKSLEKLPADRFDSAKAFAEALTSPGFATWTTSPTQASGVEAGGWKLRLAVPLAFVAALSLVAAFWGWLRPPPQVTAPVIRYTMAFPAGEEFAEAYGVSLAVSPDGSRLVYLSGSSGAFQLWSRTRDQLIGEPLVGTEDAWQPFFSPDGQQVAFVTGNRALKIVSLRGEPPRTVVDSGMWRVSGSWGSDGYLYVSMQAHGLGLVRLPIEGGAPEPVTTVDTALGELLHAWPDILPNGRGALFTAVRINGQRSQNDEVAVADLETGAHRALVRGLIGRYIDGHLVFVQYDGTMMVAPFDEDLMELTGTPQPLGSAVVARAGPDVALGANGRLVYQALGPGDRGEVELTWIDREGRTELIDLDHPVISANFGLGGPVLSPDGKWVTLAAYLDTGADIWVKELNGGPLTRLSFNGTSLRPTWSPDSRAIIYRSEEDLSYDLYSQAIDGSGTAKLVVAFDHDINHGRWSDDGRWLLVATDAPSDVYAVQIGSTDAPTPLLTSTYNETSPVLSPDGRWLAYVSDESGATEVYVSSFPNVADLKRQVSIGGGVEPMWAHSGNELFYKNPERQLVAASVRTDPTFVVVDRTALFTFDPWLQNTTLLTQYDVAPDDQRFLTYGGAPGQLTSAVTVVENVLEELREKVGNR